MQPWTLQDLQRIAPVPGRRKSDTDEHHEERVATHAGYLNALVGAWDMFAKNDMVTPLRISHFLAQAYHETGGFTIVRENCNWSLEQSRGIWPDHFGDRAPATKKLTNTAKFVACRDDEAKACFVYGNLVHGLGNTEPDDGWAYRGGGVFQGTGRSWYREAGAAIGVDLEGQPELIEDPRVSLATAIWYWRRHRLNDMADKNYLRAIGNCINRGPGKMFSKLEPIGADGRKRAFDRAWAVLGNGPLPMPEMSLGASSTEVADAQTRLKELGYPVGTVDGVFGHETGRALASFKRDWITSTGQIVEAGDEIGPATRAALATAEPISRPEREKMTVSDLKAAGSTEVADAQNLRNLAIPLALTGAGAATEATDGTPAVIQTLDSNLGWLPGFQSKMAPALEALFWSLKHIVPFLLILVAVLVWTKGGTWVKKRLEAARNGLNLSR